MGAFDVSESGGGGSKKWVKPLLWTLLAVIVVAAIVIPIAVVFSQPVAEEVPATARIACFPLDVVTEDECTQKGCLWERRDDDAPDCFLPSTSDKGYEVAKPPQSTGGTMRAELVEREGTLSLYGQNYKEIMFEVNYYTDKMLGFRFYPKGQNADRLRPPVPLNVPVPTNVQNAAYDVQLATPNVGELFNFKIVRKSSNTTLFDTSLGGLTIAKQFLMISTALPSQHLYGIGESTHDSYVHNMSYKMWPLFARDQPPQDGELNLYGSHPFYYVSEDDGSSHGVFFFNSHAIDVTTLPHPGLTYRTIGGQLEFFVFMGPTPEDVVEQYTSVIGRTVMPTYWALGFQLSRYGYKSTQDIRDTVERNRIAKIPHDVQYADIDHMEDQADFTLGQNFEDLPGLVTELQGQGMRFIVILDPAINAERSNYPTNDRAKEKDVYIKWYNSSLIPETNCTVNSSICQPMDDVMLGYVWPVNRTAFPDWFKNETKDWWIDEIKLFHDRVPFDGLWIDMNEPANFDTNKDKPFNWPADLPPWNLHCPVNEWDDPPYPTKAARYKEVPRLSDKTLCMIAKQGPNDEYLHYEVHNLYGWSETEPTLRGAQEATRTRSIVITRSTYPSSGKWAGHWLGDNTSRWKHLHTSIIGMMEFNMFGIPYIGADICGFFGNTTENMCARWMQLGAFYPFSRNHNGLEGIPQDPAQWDSVADASRKALNIRYSLLPYLYTLFYHSHKNGYTVVRPLFHEYPNDNMAKLVDRQFLWGAALLISPVLEENATSVEVYMPNDIWYDYHTGEEEPTKGNKTVLEAPLDKINLHVRGGHILPRQKPGLTTEDSRKKPFSLLVAVGKQNTSHGHLFWDDGLTTDVEAYPLRSFLFHLTKLTMSMTHEDPLNLLASIHMETIEIFGMPTKPSSVSAPDAQIDYDVETKKLTITNLQLSMNQAWELLFQY